jgi:hypothetical protein
VADDLAQHLVDLTLIGLGLEGFAAVRSKGQPKLPDLPGLPS